MAQEHLDAHKADLTTNTATDIASHLTEHEKPIKTKWGEGEEAAGAKAPEKPKDTEEADDSGAKDKKKVGKKGEKKDGKKA